jgi:hypothetical protein
MPFTCPRILLLIPALFVMACGDQPSAPEASSSDQESPHFKVISTYSSDKKSADIIVEPSGGVFTLGIHAIYFPENSICDPETSSYGVTEWDKPCTPITQPIRIHAELREQNDRTWIDFTPSLRFVPTDDSDRWVYLFMKTDAALGKTLTRKSAPPILWSPAIGMPGIDESLLDETMKTKWDKRLGGVYRRIKHFTGYNVYSGRSSSYQEY